jgi:hypothetical protein
MASGLTDTIHTKRTLRRNSTLGGAHRAPWHAPRRDAWSFAGDRPHGGVISGGDDGGVAGGVEVALRDPPGAVILARAGSASAVPEGSPAVEDARGAGQYRGHAHAEKQGVLESGRASAAGGRGGGGERAGRRTRRHRRRRADRRARRQAGGRARRYRGGRARRGARTRARRTATRRGRCCRSTCSRRGCRKSPRWSVARAGRDCHGSEYGQDAAANGRQARAEPRSRSGGASLHGTSSCVRPATVRFPGSASPKASGAINVKP